MLRDKISTFQPVAFAKLFNIILQTPEDCVNLIENIDLNIFLQILQGCFNSKLQVQAQIFLEGLIKILKCANEIDSKIKDSVNNKKEHNTNIVVKLFEICDSSFYPQIQLILLHLCKLSEKFLETAIDHFQQIDFKNCNLDTEFNQIKYETLIKLYEMGLNLSKKEIEITKKVLILCLQTSHSTTENLSIARILLNILQSKKIHLIDFIQNQREFTNYICNIIESDKLYSQRELMQILTCYFNSVKNKIDENYKLLLVNSIVEKLQRMKDFLSCLDSNCDYEVDKVKIQLIKKQHTIKVLVTISNDEFIKSRFKSNYIDLFNEIIQVISKVTISSNQEYIQNLKTGLEQFLTILI
eukprot:TRINITY_DN5326_c0_g1_i3.p1 TRINITY_DN5326_c0_g1~~TRINITY_DN5326_c0_g1_i3.p1  ORF type:complete len:355 (+),score=94.27 TRINITY_DN5326_c0_g1_i3:752-1816(+)